MQRSTHVLEKRLCRVTIRRRRLYGMYELVYSTALNPSISLFHYPPIPTYPCATYIYKVRLQDYTSPTHPPTHLPSTHTLQPKRYPPLLFFLSSFLLPFQPSLTPQPAPGPMTNNSKSPAPTAPSSSAKSPWAPAPYPAVRSSYRGKKMW